MDHCLDVDWVLGGAGGGWIFVVWMTSECRVQSGWITVWMINGCGETDAVA